MTADATQTIRALSDGLAAAVERAAASTVLVSARRRIPASGILWGDGGVIVTADHVVERDEEIVIGLPDGEEAEAQLVGRDPGSDLAVLRIEGGTLAGAEIAPQDSARVGQIVLGIGRPDTGGMQASSGVIGVIGGPWRSRRGRRIEGYLRSDITFFPGFSGGPLIDVEGRVLGLNTSHFRPGPGVTIPSAAVATSVETLLQHGRVVRAYLGIGSQVTRLPEALAAKAGGQETGLLLVSVEAESPAGEAGLLVGDILVAIEGDPVPDTEALQTALGPDRVGESIRIDVLRGGEPAELSATLVERS